MIRILAVTDDHQVLQLSSLGELAGHKVRWYWADFSSPSSEEAKLLDSYFHFHPLAIEDCLFYLQRPKMDHYDDVHFLVVHAMSQDTLQAQEVDLFIGPNYLVSYHLHPRHELDRAWEKVLHKPHKEAHGCLHAAYTVIDELVDEYFPAAQAIEDQILEFETGPQEQGIQQKLAQVFEIRNKLLKLRKTVVPMRELLYRVLNTQRIEDLRHFHLFFTDIYDHLLKLSEIIDSNREMTSDLRDHYMSLSGNRMNTIMKTLTVITVIFMPLTFIAGIYGMNFSYMPELTWHGGYFGVLFVMAALAVLMYAWFKVKGWFD
ncbi:magnesium/cobalt transporter CorA [Paenibacillus sacheonensis]|uniref:Magnesium transport protein CorA n=1 Tax=Paenibacillus sacheonensis TaxID=742054 RepID=A0A7X5C1E9_9BACL|nr:magnesium/cobalt transporter CorA [Paenibacillus sacheonensis]MBM7568998.1 magnesium transporter [Paenibacillus sacheonensis]NBC72631.1 magnesium/cobalt transporter CorA [Paenibacillus sacheonensis]